MTADRQRWAMILLRASEITIMAMVVSVTLLYTPRLADNFLGKTALFHMVTGVAVFAWGLARLLTKFTLQALMEALSGLEVSTR